VDYFLVLHKEGIFNYTRSIDSFRRLVEERQNLKLWDTRPLICAGQNFIKDVTVSNERTQYDNNFCYLQVHPNERAYAMVKKKKSMHDDAAKRKAKKEDKKPKKGAGSDEEDGDEAGSGEEDAVRSPAQPTKRKASTVEILMKSIDYRKGGTFRREQLQLNLIVGVLRAFTRLHSEMVFRDNIARLQHNFYSYGVGRANLRH
jgi:hypothetical protein